MKLVSLIAASLIAMSAAAYGQTAPGASTGRKAAEKPPNAVSTTAPKSRSVHKHRHHRMGRHHHHHRMMRKTGGDMGMQPGQAGSGQGGARRANEAPAMKK